MDDNTKAICRSRLHHLEFRDGQPLWAFVDPERSWNIVSPAFSTNTEAEAWREPFLEAEREEKRVADEKRAAAAEVAKNTKPAA